MDTVDDPHPHSKGHDEAAVGVLLEVTRRSLLTAAADLCFIAVMTDDDQLSAESVVLTDAVDLEAKALDRAAARWAARRLG